MLTKKISFIKRASRNKHLVLITKPNTAEQNRDANAPQHYMGPTGVSTRAYDDLTGLGRDFNTKPTSRLKSFKHDVRCSVGKTLAKGN